MLKGERRDRSTEVTALAVLVPPNGNIMGALEYNTIPADEIARKREIKTQPGFFKTGPNTYVVRIKTRGRSQVKC